MLTLLVSDGLVRGASLLRVPTICHPRGCAWPIGAISERPEAEGGWHDRMQWSVVECVMTESQVSALFDAHDALVRAYVNGGLGFDEFLAAYGNFPRAYGLAEQSAIAKERAVLRLFRQRIAFHVRVAAVVSGLRPGGGSTVHGDVDRFIPTVGLMRLRELVARYPEFKAEA
jgi:hypothetical protein